MNRSTFDYVKQIIHDSNNIVFFGGAGVSTASGIPDFRSATGLYNRTTGTDYSPDAKPNSAHKALVKLEKMGKLRTIITQNIDGLHQAAGSTNVIESHGER